jgi:pimeloyl-ACP methyl ester carboxylesterase
VHIREVDAPVMLVHGDADELIPFSMGERLRDQARQVGLEVDWFPVQGGTHNDTWHRAGPGYWTRLRSWLEPLGHPGAPLSPPTE